MELLQADSHFPFDISPSFCAFPYFLVPTRWSILIFHFPCPSPGIFCILQEALVAFGEEQHLEGIIWELGEFIAIGMGCSQALSVDMVREFVWLTCMYVHIISIFISMSISTYWKQVHRIALILIKCPNVLSNSPSFHILNLLSNSEKAGCHYSLHIYLFNPVWNSLHCLCSSALFSFPLTWYCGRMPSLFFFFFCSNTPRILSYPHECPTHPLGLSCSLDSSPHPPAWTPTSHTSPLIEWALL